MATSVIKESLLYGISAIAVIGIVGFSYSVYQDYKEVERVADAKNSFTFYEMCRETFEGSGDSRIYCSEKHITHEKLSVDTYEKCKSDYYNDLKAQGFNTRHMEDSENKKGCSDAQVNNIIASSVKSPNNSSSFVDDVNTSVSGLFEPSPSEQFGMAMYDLLDNPNDPWSKAIIPAMEAKSISIYGGTLKELFIACGKREISGYSDKDIINIIKITSTGKTNSTEQLGLEYALKMGVPVKNTADCVEATLASN